MIKFNAPAWNPDEYYKGLPDEVREAVERVDRQTAQKNADAVNRFVTVKPSGDVLEDLDQIKVAATILTSCQPNNGVITITQDEGQILVEWTRTGEDP